MPKMFGKGRKKKELIKGLPNLLKKIQAVCRAPVFCTVCPRIFDPIYIVKDKSSNKSSIFF